jgi:hypothetical protein
MCNPILGVDIYAISQGLKLAWVNVCKLHPVGTMSEPDITRKLYDELETILDDGNKIPRFNSDNFSLNREGKYPSWNGEFVDKEPDLNLHPKTAKKQSERLFIECKLIDTDNKKEVSLYVNHGVRRFVDGEYAWRMPQGMMLAYVRDGQTLPSALTTCFRNMKGDVGKRCQPLAGVNSVTSHEQDLHKSTHSRAELFFSDNTPFPDIDVYHLWLQSGQ